MERKSNLVDLYSFRFKKPINVLILKSDGRAISDINVLYNIYHIDPDILVCISIDPFCDELYNSLCARYQYSYIIETNNKDTTVIFSFYPIKPKLIMLLPDYQDKEIHNIIVGPDDVGINLTFVCGNFLSNLLSLTGLWGIEFAGDGFLFLDYTYMIARNFEIMESDIPTDIKIDGINFIHYSLRVKEKDCE